MVGIFSTTDIMATENRFHTENLSVKIEKDFGQLFFHLEKVSKLKDQLQKFTLSQQELSMVEYSLNTVPYTSSTYRFEASKSQQVNLIYRTEGIIGAIWEKIKAFFRWIKEQFTKLFKTIFSRTTGSSVTPDQEKKTAQVVKEVTKAKNTSKSISTTSKIEKVQTAVAAKKAANGDKSKTTIESPQTETGEMKQPTASLVKALKTSFTKEARISNEDYRTAAILESKLNPLAKNIISIFGYIGDENKIKAMIKDSFKDFIFFGEKVENSLKDVNLFSREGFFYNAEKQLSPFGSPVFKSFVEEAENIDAKYIKHFAWFFAGYSNMSVLDFNEKEMSIRHTRLQLPEVETPDLEITANLISNLMEAGCFSEIGNSLKEMQSVGPRVQKRIEAAINTAETSLDRYDPNSGETSEKAEARESYKIITGFFQNVLAICNSYMNYLESLNGLEKRISAIVTPTTDLSKLSNEDLGIILLLNQLEEEV